jgi:hypothetical protein
MDERNESASERGKFEQPRIGEKGLESIFDEKTGGWHERRKEKERRFDSQARVSEELRGAEVVVVS